MTRLCKDCGSQSDLAHVHAALQENASKTLRLPTSSVSPISWKEASRKQTMRCARERATDQSCDDSHLWAETFDRKLTDIFPLKVRWRECRAVTREALPVRKQKLLQPNRQIIPGLRRLSAWSGFRTLKTETHRLIRRRTEVSERSGAVGSQICCGLGAALR